MITIKQSEGSSRQFSLLYMPKDISKWDEQYISLSGYCGEYGPHLFAAAPELLEACENAVNQCQFDCDSQSYCRICAILIPVIQKAKGQTP